MRRKILSYILLASLLIFGIQYKDTRILWSASGDPVYVPGSTEITTLGTVSSGTWHGTAIDGAYVNIEGTEIKSTGETGGTKFLREDGDNTSSWQTVTATVEGVDVLSTGETGGTKFLREDGDNTSSWQTVPTTTHAKDIVTTSPLTVNGLPNLNDHLPGADADVIWAIADADDDGVTKGAASFDNTDFDAVAGNVTIVDDGHAHTTASISGLDISDDTNLTAGDFITLTNDDLDVDVKDEDDMASNSALHLATQQSIKAYVDTEVGAASGHTILDGTIHTDSVADAVTRGSIIYGNATPKWDELVIGTSGQVLKSDGTDISWGNQAIEDDVYGAGWNGDTSNAPTQNAVYDKMELVVTDVAANTAASHTRSHAMTSTSDHTATAYRTFYSDVSGNVQELAHGASGRVLQSNGAAANPSWEVPVSGRNWHKADATITDQSDPLESGSVSDICDNDIGANPGTIFFGHTSGNAQTTYTFTAAEEIPANVTLVVENGAVLNVSSTNNVEILGDLQAGFYKIFSHASTGEIRFGNYFDITSTGSVREVYPDWWGVTLDGATNTVSAISSAMNSLNNNGGIVFLRQGVWYINSALDVKQDITLTGVKGVRRTWTTEATVGDLHAGTWMYIDSAAFVPITVKHNGVTIKNIGFFQAHAAPGADWAPTAYPYVIEAEMNDPAGSVDDDRADDVVFEDLMFLAIYQGIRVGNRTTQESASPHLRNIEGQFFYRGLSSEWNWGNLVVNGFNHWSYWTNSDYIVDWQQNHLIVFDLEMADGALFNDIFALGALIGFDLSLSTETPRYHAPNGIRINNYWGEGFRYGVHIDPDIIGTDSTWRDLTISNMTIGSSLTDADLDESRGIFVEGDQYTILVNNAVFHNWDRVPIDIVATATGTNMHIDNFEIDGWDGSAVGHAAINVNTGNTINVGFNRTIRNGGGGGETAGAGTINIDGGGGGMTDLVDDTTPQLGGNLDGGGYTITTAGLVSAGTVDSNGRVNVTATDDGFNIRGQNVLAHSSGSSTFLKAYGSGSVVIYTVSSGGSLIVGPGGNTTVQGTLTVSGNQSGATDHVFDDYDDVELLKNWREDPTELPFERGDLLNQDRLLRDSILALVERVEYLENKLEAMK